MYQNNPTKCLTGEVRLSFVHLDQQRRRAEVQRNPARSEEGRRYRRGPQELAEHCLREWRQEPVEGQPSADALSGHL